MRLRHAAASSCIAFAVAACSDSTGPAPTTGSLSFNFSGDAVGSGTFSAVGVLSTSDTTDLPFVVALLDDTSLGLTVLAGNQDRWVGVRASGRTAGVFPIDSTCQIDNCSGMGAGFGGLIFGDAPPDYSCSIKVGTVTLVAVSSTRASGTFSGTGTCTEPLRAVSAFTVTNGAFNAPFVKF